MPNNEKSNNEKRKPFSPVDAKRLSQQNSNRLTKGHRRGKGNGSTNKTSSSKDENSSLASLVDDTGFDFLTNPKLEKIAQPMTIESTTFWSSTSKTPKISNVTLATMQPERLGKPNNGSAPNLHIQQVDTMSETSSKQHEHGSKQMPLPKRSVNLIPKCSTSKQPSRSLPKQAQDPSVKNRLISSTLETIIEGTPEQERESPPPDPQEPKALERGFDSTSLPQDSGSDFNGSEKILRSADDASDMDESSDDDLMNLTMSPPTMKDQMECHHTLSQKQQPDSKGKPPRPSAIQTRLFPGEQKENKASDHNHTPRANQNEMKQSTPHPAALLPTLPPKPQERRSHCSNVENDRPFLNEDTFQAMNSNRNAHGRPSVDESAAMSIQTTRQHKDKNAQPTDDRTLTKSVVEKAEMVLIPIVNRPKSEVTTKTTYGNHQHRSEQISLEVSNHIPKPRMTKAESIHKKPAADFQDVNLPNDNRSTKRIVCTPQIPPDASYSRSNQIDKEKTIPKQEFAKKSFPTEEKGDHTSHQLNTHQKTMRNANNQGLKQSVDPKIDDKVLNREIKPTGNAVFSDENSRAKQAKMKAPFDEGNNLITIPRGGIKSYNVPSSGTKRTVIEPINKEVWRAMMAPPAESKKDITGLLGFVIETPAQGAVQDDSKSIDGSELTQDTFFLLDWANSLRLNESSNPQPSSPMYTNPNLPLDLQGLTKMEKQDITPFPYSSAEAKLEKSKSNSDTDQDQASPQKQNPLSLPSATPTKRVTPAMYRRNANEKPMNKAHPSTTNQLTRTPNSNVLFSTPFPTIPPRAPVEFIDSVSKSGRHMQILHDDVYSEPLSTVTKTAVPKRLQPTLWTSEIAGSKVKALGVNAAPVFRLDPGKYFRHPPLPPGWTIAVSRSQNMPFYIHPDFGATFYSPVPLPSIDGKVQGTTLLYQADTPEYRQTENEFVGSQAASTPIIFGLTQSSYSTDKTSSVATHRFENNNKDTPIGALVVATNDQFSDMNVGENTSSGFQEALQVPSHETASQSYIDKKTEALSSPHTESASQEWCSSPDSTTTVTVASSCHFRKRGIPNEIEIVFHENMVDDDKFQMHLDATAEHERHIPSGTFQETTPSKNRYNIVPENKTPQNDAKSPASIKSNDASLDWVTGISMDSNTRETSYHSKDMIMLHQSDLMTTHTYSKKSTDRLSPSQNIRLSVDSPQSDNISFIVDDNDHSPSIPQKIIVGIDFDGDDMSRLQCTPLQHDHSAIISSRFEPFPAPHLTSLSDIKSTLLNNEEQDAAFYEDRSHHSDNSRSYTSLQSGLSIASRRSLHPLLPLCSLQNLQFVKAHQNAEKKRKKEPKIRQVKRQRTSQTVPISE